MNNQPFLFSKQNSERILVYCDGSNETKLFFGSEFNIVCWKLTLKDEQNIKTLNTVTELENYGKVFVECNPHLFYKNNQLYIGYNAGFSNGKNTPILYYYLTAKTNENLTEFYETTVIKKCFTSAYINDDYFYAKKTKDKDLLIKNEQEIVLNNSIKYIYRINPIYNVENYFIVTFSENSEDSKTQSWIFDKEGNQIIEIKNSKNDSVYKCTILNDTLVYTEKVDQKQRILVEETLNDELKNILYN